MSEPTTYLTRSNKSGIIATSRVVFIDYCEQIFASVEFIPTAMPCFNQYSKQLMKLKDVYSVRLFEQQLVKNVESRTAID